MSEETKNQPDSMEFDLNEDYAFDQIAKKTQPPAKSNSDQLVQSSFPARNTPQESDVVKPTSQPKPLSKVNPAKETIALNKPLKTSQSLSRLQQVRQKKEFDKIGTDAALPEENQGLHFFHILLYGLCIFIFLVDFILSAKPGSYLKGGYFFLWNLFWLFAGGISLEKISHMVLGRHGMTRQEGWYVFGWSAGIFLVLYVIIFLLIQPSFMMFGGYRLLMKFVLGLLSMAIAIQSRGHYDRLPSWVIGAICTIWMMLLYLVGTELGNLIFPSRF